jgi:hypothetical protein
MDYTEHAMWLGLVFLLTLVACSPGPLPVRRDAQDPSNPHAAEGVDPVAAVRTTSAPAATTAATAFTCPMHPEVVSDHAGHCPKCGMNLVPKP